MKYPILLSVMLCLLAGCSKSDIQYENTFDKSYKAWQSFKASSNNSYEYSVVSGSVFGASSQTVIQVSTGIVIGRSYTATMLDQNTHENKTVEQWTEDKNTLGTHTKGASVITLDDIYQQAKSDWLKKRKDAKTYFENKNSGMISSCGYVPNGCQDDCFQGINIGYINSLHEVL